MKVVFIGSGNLATQLALAFKAKGVFISQIYSRTSSNAKLLANQLGAKFTSRLSEIEKDADIYIYAVKDNAFHNIIKEINLPNALHIHTAGSIPLNDFEGFAKNYGVFYPLQTFSKKKEVDFSQIPVFIEGSDLEVQNKLFELAQLLTQEIYIINSEQRKQLHLAAVFACNFTNYMYDIASEIILSAGLNFDVLKPLIAETANKIKTMTPRDAQTGPAVRYDENTINNHLLLLNKNKDQKSIYKLLSKNIYKTHNSE